MKHAADRPNRVTHHVVLSASDIVDLLAGGRVAKKVFSVGDLKWRSTLRLPSSGPYQVTVTVPISGDRSGEVLSIDECGGIIITWEAEK